MLPIILTVDFPEGSNVWIVRLKFPDGRCGQAQIGLNAFQAVRACPMGQFMLHAWLSRASVLPEAMPTQP